METVPQTSGANEAECTLKYLEACNNLFEKGFLSHDKVSASNKVVLANIERGYKFFCKWLDGIYKQGWLIVLCFCTQSNGFDI